MTRKTVPLTGSVAPLRAELDALSSFRLLHAQAFLHAAGRKRIHSSGVIRRALEVYASHLANLEDPAQEFRKATLASQSSGMDAEAQKEAAVRFQESAQAAAQGTPPGDFSALLHGPGVLNVGDVTARAEELAASLSNGWRCRPGKAPGRAGR